jgi:hypothetical protein
MLTAVAPAVVFLKALKSSPHTAVDAMGIREVVCEVLVTKLAQVELRSGRVEAPGLVPTAPQRYRPTSSRNG